ARTLAAKFPTKLVRARRDFAQLLALITASAILHQRQRDRDAHDRIIATDADYRLVYELAAPVFGAAATEGVTPTLRQTVAAVEELTAGSARRTVSSHQLGLELNLAKSTVSDRVKNALRGGYLVNEELDWRKPHRLRVGDPLPTEATLPSPETLGD